MLTRHLTEREASILCGYSVAWLRARRHFGGGPPYRKFDVAVRYPLDLLEQWVNNNSQLRGTNSDVIVSEYEHIKTDTSLLEFIPNVSQHW